MPNVVAIKPSPTSAELSHPAATGKLANQSRRLLLIAVWVDGTRRADAAKIGGMDRQALRDGTNRFNALDPDGLKNNRRPANPRRLSPAQQRELVALVETSPYRAVHRRVRWRRVHLRQVIAARYGVDDHARSIGKLMKAWGVSHISARPPNPKQNGHVIEAHQKMAPARSQPTSRA
jgi:transposase